MVASIPQRTSRTLFMDSDVQRFRAHKDALGAMFALVIFAVGIFLLACGDIIPWPMADKFGWLFLIFGVLAVWDWWVTCYEFDQEELIIRSGLSTNRISLCNIEEVYPRGRGLCLKCQQLRGAKWLTVRPKDSKAFVQRLSTKCPWLYR